MQIIGRVCLFIAIKYIVAIVAIDIAFHATTYNHIVSITTMNKIYAIIDKIKNISTSFIARNGIISRVPINNISTCTTN